MADALQLSILSSYSVTKSANSLLPALASCQLSDNSKRVISSLEISSAAGAGYRLRKQLHSFKVHATVPKTEQPKWWEKNTPNMIDIHSTQEFLDALSQAGDRLVIVEYFGTWCASCRALFPKLCRIAREHPEILFLKVNFDENKQMCKSLNVKVLPYFHFYHGADGQVESFSCSLVKFQKLKDAIETHNGAPSKTGPPKGVGDLNLEAPSAPKEDSAESTST